MDITNLSARCGPSSGPRAPSVAWRRLACGVALATLATCAPVVIGEQESGRHWFVSPQGTAGSAGTLDAPLDLATALSRQSPAAPGDTVWLRGGIYRGRFDSHLKGTADAPITVRQLHGERAVLDGNDGTVDPPDGVLNVRADGGYTRYWGFEVTNSDTKRASNDSGPFPRDLYRSNGVNVYASNVTLINLVIHDVENGIFVGDEPTGVAIYGVIAYYNGHDAPEMAWGHGIYVQNKSRVVVRSVKDTIAASNFSHGVHAYAGSGTGLNAIHLEGNIAFQNGVISRRYLVRNLLLGGLSVAADAAVVSNYTYFSRPEGENNIGWTTGAPGAVVEDNRFMGGRRSLVWGGKSTPARMSRNVFYGLTTPATLPTEQPSNVYLGNDRPQTLEYFVRPNQYERGRAHVVVYNWPLQAEVAVDLGAIGLRPGALYEIRDVQNYFGPPVVSGAYEGRAVTIPLGARTVAPPVGNILSPAPAHTLPEFGAFVVTPVYARRR